MSLEARIAEAAPPPEEGCVADPPFDLGRLAEWRAGQLDEAAGAEVVEHLAGCADCRAVLAELRPLSAAEQGRMTGRRPRRRVLPVAVLAAAAILIFAVLRPTASPLHLKPGPVEGGELVMRGGERSLAFGGGSILSWSLRPQSAQQPPAARAYVLLESGARALPASVLQPLPGGGLRLRAPATELFRGPAGARRIGVAIARTPEALPTAEQAGPGPNHTWYERSLTWMGN